MNILCIGDEKALFFKSILDVINQYNLIYKHERDFKDNEFAKFHPGGSLRRRLLATVENVMNKELLPVCTKDDNIKTVIHKITDGKCGLVVLKDNNIEGIIIDGDIRRAMELSEDKFFTLKASCIMSKNPKTINLKEKLTSASDLMSNTKINSLLVVNDTNTFVGIVQMYVLGI